LIAEGLTKNQVASLQVTGVRKLGTLGALDPLCWLAAVYVSEPPDSPQPVTVTGFDGSQT
jgi:hypothetical protein